MFSRMSFRQMLLAGFVLIALVLSAAALQGLRVLESFAQQSRAGADTALLIVALLGALMGPRLLRW